MAVISAYLALLSAVSENSSILLGVPESSAHAVVPRVQVACPAARKKPSGEAVLPIQWFLEPRHLTESVGDVALLLSLWRRAQAAFRLEKVCGAILETKMLIAWETERGGLAVFPSNLWEMRLET